MQPYSPFTKRLRDLQTADLAALRRASEGWYIEYKREAPKAASLAKSLSAFANTYGGWLFIGVIEASKQEPVAGAFPGLSTEDVVSVLQRLRKCATDHLNPTPYFESRVLWGDQATLELPEGRAVVCVWVPQSNTAPHVHKSGHIYRRVSDASEPKAENDRFVLDQLWHRADDVKRQHEEWYNRDPEFSETEVSQPYVRLMLIADRWSQRDVYIDADRDKVRAALAQTAGPSSIPFDTIHTSPEGFVGRQLNGNNPLNMTLTWLLRRNLRSDVIVPLPFYELEHMDELEDALAGYDNAQRFGAILKKYPSTKLRIVDLNYLFNVLVGVAEIQERLCTLAEWDDNYYIKLKILNAWRTIPFIDIPEVLLRFEKYGPPMCLDSVTSVPHGSGPDDYVEVARHFHIESDVARVLIQGVVLFTPLALAYGVPSWLPEEEEGTANPYFMALQEAGRRAINVQRRRNSET